MNTIQKRSPSPSGQAENSKRQAMDETEDASYAGGAVRYLGSSEILLNSADKTDQGIWNRLCWGQLVFDVGEKVLIKVTPVVMRTTVDPLERVINFLSPQSYDYRWLAQHTRSPTADFEIKMNLREILKKIIPSPLVYEHDIKPHRLHYYDLENSKAPQPIDFFGQCDQTMTGTLVMWAEDPNFTGGEFQFNDAKLPEHDACKLGLSYKYRMDKCRGFGRRLFFIYYPQNLAHVVLPTELGNRLLVVCRVTKRPSHSKPREKMDPESQQIAPQCIESSCLIYSTHPIAKFDDGHLWQPQGPPRPAKIV
jgi:hypothetical protein